MRRIAVAIVVLLLSAGGAWGSIRLQSTDWSISGAAFGAAGAEGAVLSSSGFRLTIVALGEPAAGAGVLAGATFRMNAGLVSGAAPPTEVRGVRLPDPMTLRWDPQAPAVAYHVYRDGGCLATVLAAETADISSDPPAGGLHLYLVTAENPLGETGTPGAGSDGVERPIPLPCP